LVKLLAKCQQDIKDHINTVGKRNLVRPTGLNYAMLNANGFVHLEGREIYRFTLTPVINHISLLNYLPIKGGQSKFALNQADFCEEVALFLGRRPFAPLARAAALAGVDAAPQRRDLSVRLLWHAVKKNSPRHSRVGGNPVG
jgi:hypothetical protein